MLERGVGHSEHKVKGDSGGRPPTTVGFRKLESLGYHVRFREPQCDGQIHNDGG